MIKIAGIAFCILVCSVLLRDKNKPFAIAVAVFGGCLLLFGNALYKADDEGARHYAYCAVFE